MFNRKGDINEDEIEELLQIVNNVYGYDFTNYSRASMHRRISRFIDAARYADLAELKHKIATNKEVFDFFLQRITVNVTEMFRDPQFYKVMRKQVLPVIAS